MHEIVQNIMCCLRQSARVEELECFLLSHINNVGPNCSPSVQIKSVSPQQALC